MQLRWTAAAAAAAIALAACEQEEQAILANNLVEGEPVTNQVQDLVPTPANPIEYANLVAASNLYEIRAAEMAVERAETPAVRELAQTILSDHREATEALAEAAERMEPAMTITPTLTAEQQRDLNALDGAAGTEFERLWLLQQVAAHEETYGIVQHYAETGQAGPMREHAIEIRDTLARHLEQARSLAEAAAQSQ